MRQGNIGVTTENIFPVIKKFLYSDHEIFLREIVSNAVDAVQKLKTLSEKGEFKGELDQPKVEIKLDKAQGTITISDNGIGMTAEEIDKYINQIAFSGVTDFLEKYKDTSNSIIGHFGLGFYSSFMVSNKVEIITKSYKQDAQPVKWSCDGTPHYSIEETSKDSRGTDIVLYIDEENKDFLEKQKIQELLNKYCKFLPVPVILGKKTEWKDGKNQETDQDNVINDVKPLWTQTPNTIKEEDYKQFYNTLYPMQDEPLFWIHLNVDYPFNLTGILYFPKVTNNIELQRNKIQLYCNQVFVTDQVEGVVPEFLTLLHGVIDSPDIPLNVSRSYLQSDADVKKISTYITKKVADRLNGIFKENRKEYEEKWDHLKIFIDYGMLSQEEFYNRAKDFALFKDTENKYFTFEEYQTLIKDNQTDKDGNLTYLYTNNPEEQYSYIQAAKAKGYSVLLMQGQLDTPLIGLLEQKNEKSRFVRVDSNVIDNIIRKADSQQTAIDEDEKSKISDIFHALLQSQKAHFITDVQALGNTTRPVVITQSEYMRRMKEMSRLQPGMAFYGQMPDTFTFILNIDHPLIQKILDDCNAQTAEQLQKIQNELNGLNARMAAISQMQKNKKEDELTDKEKEDKKNTQAEIDSQSEKRKSILAEYAKANQSVHQLIDLALLQNGMLKGEALEAFLERSLQMI